jgi:hypothetical protein
VGLHPPGAAGEGDQGDDGRVVPDRKVALSRGTISARVPMDLQDEETDRSERSGRSARSLRALRRRRARSRGIVTEGPAPIGDDREQPRDRLLVDSAIGTDIASQHSTVEHRRDEIGEPRPGVRTASEFRGAGCGCGPCAADGRGPADPACTPRRTLRSAALHHARSRRRADRRDHPDRPERGISDPVRRRGTAGLSCRRVSLDQFGEAMIGGGWAGARFLETASSATFRRNGGRAWTTRTN